MNEYLDPMFPDKDHLRHFPDDANSDPPQSSELRVRVRPVVFLTGIGIGALVCLGIAIAIIVIVASGCKVNDPPCLYDANGHVNHPCVITPETMASEKRWQAAVKAKQLELLKKQHGDMSKAMRDYRMP